ncbi:hypothetical protein D3C81_694850 [compost metagenome]
MSMKKNSFINRQMPVTIRYGHFALYSRQETYQISSRPLYWMKHNSSKEPLNPL